MRKAILADIARVWAAPSGAPTAAGGSDSVANLRALNVDASGGAAFAALRLLGRLVR